MRRLALLVVALIGTIVAIVVFRRHGRDPSLTDPAPRGERALRRPHRPLPGQPTAAQRIRSADEPEGELAIAGRVVALDGIPVPGARVALDTLTPVETTSGRDGQFRLGELPARPFRVEARLGDRYAGPILVMPDEDPEPITLTLRRGSTLVVSVAGDAEPIPGALVELLAPAAIIEQADGAGRATLAGVAPGRANLRVTAEGWAAAWVDVSVRDSPLPTAVDVTLVRGAAASGRVVDPDGRPVAGARVAIEQCEDAARTGEAAAVTDRDGRWSLPTLPAGTYLLVAGHPDFAPGQAFVEVGPAKLASDVTIALGRGARVSGRVVDRAGAPIGRALVVAASGQGDSPGYVFAPPVFAYSGADGAFVFGGLDPGEITFEATHERGGSDRVTLELADAKPIDLVLTIIDGGTIRGVVVAHDGTPIAGAEVRGYRHTVFADAMREPRRGGRTEDVTGAEGEFELGGLAEGTWSLSASVVGFTAAHVTAETGGAPVRMVLERFARVRGRLRFSDGTTPDRFGIGPRWNLTDFAGTAGAFVLEEVPPGPLDLTARSPEFPETRLPPSEVAPGADLDLGTITISRGRTVRGRVVTADGSPAAGVHLELGTGLVTFIPRTQQTVTDSDGRFEVRGLEDGPIQARTRGGPPLAGEAGDWGPISLPVGDTGDADAGTLRLAPAP